MKDKFVKECLEEDGGATPASVECQLAYPRLSEAVDACNRRAECGGITYTPLGVFELRGGPAFGNSGRSEVSWLKKGCDGVMNVIPVGRCLTRRRLRNGSHPEP